MGRKARRRKRRMRSRSRSRRRKEQEEVTDVRRARRRHLRRIRMRGGEVQWPERYREVQRCTERYREVERGTVASRRKKCYGRAVLLTLDNRSA